MSDKMKEFLDKVDRLCWEYKFEIKPTHPVPDKEYPTISIIGDGETVKLLYIDGEGIGINTKQR
jgi:hypothetical protein